MSNEQPDARQLRFLEAARVESPAGDLAGVTLQTSTDETLGTLSGVLIDPGERRLRYYVVQKPGWLRTRHILISADNPVQVEPTRNALRVDAEPLELVDPVEFDPKSVREFSTEDALAAMFARTVSDLDGSSALAAR